MVGIVSAYNNANGYLTFTSDFTEGSGTYNSWTVNLSGPVGATGIANPAGSNTQVQFNDEGNFGGSSNLTFDTTTNVLALNGNLALAATSAISIDGDPGLNGQVLTSNGTAAYWSTKYYYGDTPPDFATLNYGDIFFYIDNPNSIQRLYMWVTDGSSDYFYDFLPPTF
jgi:hypothetical protein